MAAMLHRQGYLSDKYYRLITWDQVIYALCSWLDQYIFVICIFSRSSSSWCCVRNFTRDPWHDSLPSRQDRWTETAAIFIISTYHVQDDKWTSRQHSKKESELVHACSVYLYIWNYRWANEERCASLVDLRIEGSLVYIVLVQPRKTENSLSMTEKTWI